MPLALRSEAVSNGLAAKIAKCSAERDEPEAVGGGFFFEVSGGPSPVGELLFEPAGGFSAFLGGTTGGARGRGERLIGVDVDRLSRPADDGQSGVGVWFDLAGQAGGVGGDVVLDGKQQAALWSVPSFGRRIFADQPSRAGGGDEGQAADRAVDGLPALFAEVADEDECQAAALGELGQGGDDPSHFRVDVFDRAAQVGADRVNDHQRAVRVGIQQAVEDRHIAAEVEDVRRPMKFRRANSCRMSGGCWRRCIRCATGRTCFATRWICRQRDDAGAIGIECFEAGADRVGEVVFGGEQEDGRRGKAEGGRGRAGFGNAVSGFRLRVPSSGQDAPRVTRAAMSRAMRLLPTPGSPTRRVILPIGTRPGQSHSTPCAGTSATQTVDGGRGLDRRHFFFEYASHVTDGSGESPGVASSSACSAVDKRSLACNGSNTSQSGETSVRRPRGAGLAGSGRLAALGRLAGRGRTQGGSDHRVGEAAVR